jgi:phospholipid transport system substrate-binding protein
MELLERFVHQSAFFFINSKPFDSESRRTLLLKTATSGFEPVTSHKDTEMLKPLKSTLLAAALSLGVAMSAQAAGNTPVDLVRDTSTQVLDILHKDNGGNSAKVDAQVESLVLPRFDFKRMTALAVGLDWRQANASQQAELTHQFQQLLVHSYASTMSRYKNAHITVLPNPVLDNNGREATVKSQVATSESNQPVTIEYTFYQTTQGWKVYNVKVEGASLITAYRNSFSEEVRKGGVDGLIKALQAKNAALAGA